MPEEGAEGKVIGSKFTSFSIILLVFLDLYQADGRVLC